MIEVTVDSILMSQATNKRVVWLKERDGERVTSIWIGPFEAESIAMRLYAMPSARPLPYDLMQTMLAGLGVAVKRVAVTHRDEIFYAAITLDVAGKEKEFDARASDAINLAIRAGAPIFVDESLLAAPASADCVDAA